MPINPQYDTMFSASQLQDAAKDCLQVWFPEYVREIESQLGIPMNTLDIPENYTQRNRFDSIAGEKIPAVVIISPGTQGVPTKDGLGVYRATWALGIGVKMAAGDEDTADLYAKAYGAVVRSIIMNQLDSTFLNDTQAQLADKHWAGDKYEPIAIRGQLQIYRACGVFFTVDVGNVLVQYAGPDEPNQGPFPVVEHVFVDEIKVGIGDEV